MYEAHSQTSMQVVCPRVTPLVVTINIWENSNPRSRRHHCPLAQGLRGRPNLDASQRSPLPRGKASEIWKVKWNIYMDLSKKSFFSFSQMGLVFWHFQSKKLGLFQLPLKLIKDCSILLKTRETNWNGKTCHFSTTRLKNPDIQ